MDTKWVEGLTFREGPKYMVVRDAIARAVELGHLDTGAKLPPVRDLAYRLSITPGTVARAYSILTDQGVLRGEVGRGTFVADTKTAFLPEVPSEGRPATYYDPVPHGTALDDGPVSLMSPGIANRGQAEYLRKLLTEVAQDPPSGLMHYPTRESFRAVREAAKHWLRHANLGTLDEIDIVMAHGGQNAILLVMQAVLRGRRPTVLVEELSYAGFRRAAQLLRADVVPVAMDAHGIIPSALEAAAGPEAQLLCMTPNLHNPTCLFTPEWRRREIAAVARRCNFHILEDDWYQVPGLPAPSYRQLAPERSWYVSSISKLVTPSLRIGFAVSPPGGGRHLRRAAEDGFFGLATVLADVAAKMMTDPVVEALVDDVRATYRERIQVLLNHLGGYDITWQTDAPICWLRLPEGWRTTAFCTAAEAQGVRVRSGEDFAPREANTPQAVRIALNASIPLERFEAAARSLRDLLDTPPERVGV
ncbi:MAG: PLP-dependent aminotransferase family protein [Pseudomonadota bacterium]